MQLLVINNCSARKTAAPIRGLSARHLPRGTASELAVEWRTRCTAADKRVTAQRLYAGRGFSLARTAARSVAAEFRIISAGMGLVHPEAPIPPYSLTLSRSATDCILSRALSGMSFSADEWWREISTHRSGFSRLAARYPRALVIIAATSPYLLMVVKELASLPQVTRDRLRIIGLAQRLLLPGALQPCVMPYDSRLNGHLGALRGTGFDFPARALAHFIGLVGSDRRIGSPEDHAQRVRRSLSHSIAPTIVSRNRIDDYTLNRHVELFKKQNTSRTVGLRRLRCELGLACSQERFAAAWDSA